MPANPLKPSKLSTHDKLRYVWGRMRQSCYDTKHVSYKNYGARGITVDLDAWPTGASFADWALVNGFEPGLTVERIDSNGNYTPSNVTFVTRLAQQRNRTVNVYYDYQGERLILAEVLERELGNYTRRDYSRTDCRIRDGWELLTAVRTPVYQQPITLHSYRGEMLTLTQIIKRHFANATESDVSRVYSRVRSGLSVEEALTRPCRPRKIKQPAEHLV